MVLLYVIRGDWDQGRLGVRVWARVCLRLCKETDFVFGCYWKLRLQ